MPAPSRRPFAADAATPPGFDDADSLLTDAVTHGREVLHSLLTAAVARQLAEKVLPPVQPLFTPADRAALADLMTRVSMAGDLTGRVRVVKMAERMRAKHRRQFAAGVAELVPPALPPTSQAAVDFFAGLIPRLGLDPRVYGPLMERHAFTLAIATERTLVKKVQAAIADYLRTDWDAADAADKPSGAAVVQAVLDRVGVTPGNPQYCFLPGTRVEGAVLAASKAWYDGPAVQIETDDGRLLAVTVNHPVLTAAGWKRAGDVTEGDDLVCYGRAVEAFGASRFLGRAGQPAGALATCPRGAVRALASVQPPSQWRTVHDEQAPPCIEDVFEAIAGERSAFRHVQRPASTLDFYGDAAFFPGEVHAVWAYRELVSDRHTTPGQVVPQVGFVHGHVVAHVVATDPTGESSRLLRFACDRPLDASLAAGERLQDRGLLRRGNSGPEPLHAVTPVSQLDPVLYQATEKRLGGDVKLGRDLIHGLPGEVSLRRVVKVERISWTGHVYDLQTETGFIVAQGIVATNCEMVFRTNVMDALNTGVSRQLATPEMREDFPAWRYLGIDDGREGDDHRPKFGKLYPSSVPFTVVRGPRVFNCRCTAQPIHIVELEQLLAAGERVESAW